MRSANVTVIPAPHGRGASAAPRAARLSDRLPLWYQITQVLRSEVLATHDPEPVRLATEHQLAERFGVSVLTVRQALGSLAEEGLIVRRPKLGTFTNPHRTSVRPLKLLGTLEAVFAQQDSEETIVLDFAARIPRPPGLAVEFKDQREVARFKRLRREHGEVLSIAENFVPLSVARAIKPGMLETAPMTKVLRDRLKMKIASIDNTIEARQATPDIAAMLGIEPLQPVLFMTGVTRDASGKVLDVAHIWYRADRYRYSVSLKTT